jgi:hypothetical protein
LSRRVCIKNLEGKHGAIDLQKLPLALLLPKEKRDCSPKVFLCVFAGRKKHAELSNEEVSQAALHRHQIPSMVRNYYYHLQISQGQTNGILYSAALGSSAGAASGAFSGSCDAAEGAAADVSVVGSASDEVHRV